MRQIAYPAALGSCVLGAGASQVRAAEWSITPIYSSSVDYDSNRPLLAHTGGSGAAVLTADVRFKRALEDLELVLEPRYSLRRFSDRSLGNGDDRSVSAGLSWANERSSLGLNAAYWDQSTLATELQETGIVSGDTHRRTQQAGANWSWNQTERRATVAQVSYLNVSYYGPFRALLPGYRYPSGSLGERFRFNERGSFTLSAFGSRLQSDTPGNSSRELGLQAQVVYSFSEKTDLDATVGESSRVLQGASSSGTDISVLLNHSMNLATLSLSYTRSLVPYGTGFLVERQQLSATVKKNLTTYLDTTLSLYRSQNNDNAVRLHLDRRSYDSASIGFGWHPAQTWTVSGHVEHVWTQLPDETGAPVRSWRSGIAVTWSPLPGSRSW